MTEPVFVLSGGGNLGAVQAGMLHALLRAGIRPRALVGSSVGALNAAALSSDTSLARADELVAAWRGTRARHVFGGDRRLGMLGLALGRPALHHTRSLESLIRRFVDVDDLSQTEIPLHVSTTELSSGETRWWRAGDPVTVLTASCAIPLVFPPVELGGSLHADGALVEPVGLRRAAAITDGPIVVLDTGATSMSLGPVDGGIRPIVAAIRAGRMARLADDRRQVDPDRVHWVDAPCPQLRYDDFSRTGTLIELGREAVLRFLARQPALLPH
jgi:NTE family protein